jgi:hypothetical protein
MCDWWGLRSLWGQLVLSRCRSHEIRDGPMSNRGLPQMANNEQAALRGLLSCRNITQGCSHPHKRLHV